MTKLSWTQGSEICRIMFPDGGHLAAIETPDDVAMLDPAKTGPTCTADSFDRAVEATLRSQIKR